MTSPHGAPTMHHAASCADKHKLQPKDLSTGARTIACTLLTHLLMCALLSILPPSWPSVNSVCSLPADQDNRDQNVRQSCCLDSITAAALLTWLDLLTAAKINSISLNNMRMMRRRPCISRAQPRLFFKTSSVKSLTTSSPSQLGQRSSQKEGRPRTTTSSEQPKGTSRSFKSALMLPR